MLTRFTIMTSLAIVGTLHGSVEARRAEAPSLRLVHHAVLRAGPRETSPVVARVARGVRVSVVRAKADWRKVTTRAGGASGWVPRDLLGEGQAPAARRKKVAPIIVDDAETAPETRSRFADIPLQGGRFEAPPITVARLAIPEAIPVRSAPATIVVQAAAPSSEVAAAASPAGLPWFELGVGAGVEATQYSLRSASRLPLGSYVATMAAAAVDVATLARYRPRGPWELAAQLRYRLASSPAGVRMRVAGGPIEELAVGHEQTDLSVEAGWRSRRTGGAAVLVRGGYHLESTQIDRGLSVSLPSEHLEGPTAGITVDAPAILPAIDLRLSFDTLLHATRNQTPGLREGARAPTLGLFGRGRVRYRVTASWAVDLAYSFSQTRTELSGASERLPDIDLAHRSTTTHLATIGTTYLLD